MKAVILSLLGLSTVVGLAAGPFVPASNGISKVTILSITRVESKPSPIAQDKLICCGKSF